MIDLYFAARRFRLAFRYGMTAGLARGIPVAELLDQFSRFNHELVLFAVYLCVVPVRDWRLDRAESAHGLYVHQQSNDADLHHERFGFGAQT